MVVLGRPTAAEFAARAPWQELLLRVSVKSKALALEAPTLGLPVWLLRPLHEPVAMMGRWCGQNQEVSQVFSFSAKNCGGFGNYG